MGSAGVIISVSIPLTLYPQRLDYLKRVVDALLPQLQAEDRLVFVDDGSCKEVRDYLTFLGADQPGQIGTLFRNSGDSPEGLSEDGRPWRLASSRNLGAEQVGEHGFYAFLDADCVPVADWLDVYRATPAVPLGGISWLVFGQTRHQGLTRGEGTWDDPRLAGRSPGRSARRLVALFERGGGGNMAISNFAWEQTGGFDEDFDGGFGYEETELACRLFERGGEVWYVPTAEVLHLYHNRSKPHFHNIERNRRLFMQKTGLSAFAKQERR